MSLVIYLAGSDWYLPQVDGDTSTNDTVIALASGLSGSTLISSVNCNEAMQLQACLDAVSLPYHLAYFLYYHRIYFDC